MNRWLQSIQGRLIAAMALILVVGAGVIAVAAQRYGRQAADEAYDRLLTGAALQISERIVVADGGLQVDLPISAFELLSLAHEDRIYYRIVGPDGGTLTGYDKLPLPPRASPKAGTTLYSTAMFGAPVRAVAVDRLLAERSISGKISVIVAQTMAARTTLARDITAKAIILIALAGAASMAIVLFAVRVSLKPLERIEKDLQQRDPRDLSPLHVSTPREMQTVVSAINDFMHRLRSRMDMMQSFIADAAHQLRTPLTAIRAQAEMATDETDPGRVRQIAKRIHKRARGMSRLADQLLSHALIIHRADAVPLAIVDLRKIALQVASETDFDDGHRNSLRLDLPDESVSVRGDAVSLAEAVKNLVNNARRHGVPPIKIAVENGGDKAAIAVTDGGAGIPEVLWDKVGERFLRSGGTPADSAGVGLAIVSAVADAHGGALVFTRADQGFRAALQLPLAGGAEP